MAFRARAEPFASCKVTPVLRTTICISKEEAQMASKEKQQRFKNCWRASRLADLH